MDSTAALPPPSGEESNFINPYSVHPTLIALAIVLLALSESSIAVRTYTRAVILRQFDLNDFALLVSGGLFAVFATFQILTGEHGQGRHQWNVTQTQFSNLLKDLNTIEVLYGPTMFLAKYAVLRQIELIFLHHRRQVLAYKVIWALVWLNLMFYTAITLSFVFACVPREKIWNPTIPGRCIDSIASVIATSAINVLSDIAILVVPIVGVWRLHAPLKTKIGVGAVFAVGIFATASSVIRLYYSIGATSTQDLTWAVHPVACWGLAEFTTVILVACFPSFPRFVAHLRSIGSKHPTQSSMGRNASKTPGRSRDIMELEDGSSTTALRL